MGRTWTQQTLLTTAGLGLALGSNLAQAAIYDRQGNKIPDAQVDSSVVDWELLSSVQGKKYNGVGLLEQDDEGYCTAFFLNTSGDENAPAYAVTNGHCSDINKFPHPQEIIVNRPARITFKLNYFVNQKTHLRPVPVQRIVYATMKGTDITILELGTTFKQLVKEGFTPLTIDQVPAREREPIEIIGIPMTGVEPSQRFLHRTVCEVGQSVNLREDVYEWQKSIRTRCSSVGGMSGSPVVSLTRNRVIAIANTGVDDEALSQPECSLNRPCEVSNDQQVATFPLENYAQRVNSIPSCFNPRGIFNLNLPSCELEKP
jgi:V8-like Glu-specific endopeptidase